jgi:hypothetical protein
MKPKTLVILLVILGVLAGAGALLMHSRNAQSPSGEMGAPLFEGLPANDIASIHIQTPTAAVTVKQAADAWVVAERFGYPADFAKLSDLVRTLREVKTGRKFHASDDVVRRLALMPPDAADAAEGEKGTRIQMRTGEGKPILDVVVGNTRARDPQKGPPDGQYVMLSDDSEIYLIDKILSSFESDPAKWLQKSPVQVEEATVRRIACLEPDGTTVRYAVERSASGKEFEWMSPSTDRKIKKSSLNRLSRALSDLKIEDVERAPGSIETGNGEGDAAFQLDYTLFDGRVYRVHILEGCSPTTPCRIRIEAACGAPENQDAGADQEDQSEKDGSAGTEEEEKPSASAAEAAQENARLAPWIFIIPEWQRQAFFTDPEQLLEKEAEK